MTVKMPRPDDRADAQRGQRPGPEGFFQGVPGLFRIADQLVDGLAGNQLAEQDRSPHPVVGMQSEKYRAWPVRGAFQVSKCARGSVLGMGFLRELRAVPLGSREQQKRRKVNQIGEASGTPGLAVTLLSQPEALLLREELLPLGDAARQLFDLLLLCAARFCPLRLGSGLLAGGTLQLLPFLYIFNLGSVCHL